MVVFSFHSKSWQVYKRNANKLLAELRQEFPGIQSETNPTKPRSKSFECTLKKEDGEGMLCLADTQFQGCLTYIAVTDLLFSHMTLE